MRHQLIGFRRCVCWLAGIAAAFCAVSSYAQRPEDNPDYPRVLAEVPSVPWLHSTLQKVNAGATLGGVHDSGSGWYTLVTPAVSYTWGPRVSADVSVPVYVYRLAQSEYATSEKSVDPGKMAAKEPVETGTGVRQLQAQWWAPGDVVFALHASFVHGRFSDTITPSFTAPTGDPAYGLGTGRVSFDANNHFEAAVSRSALVLELGAGNSSNLFNRFVTRDYSALGALAHFQAGVRSPLPWGALFESTAYEQLPVGDNKVYTTLTRPGFPNQTVLSGRGVSEDNGLTNVLWVPLDGHWTVQGYYNRSLRLHTDTVGLGLSFVLRGTSRRRRSSIYDSIRSVR